MVFVSRVGLLFGRTDPARFECQACGTGYELDRQMCSECGGYCIGYRDSWLEQELEAQSSREPTY